SHQVLLVQLYFHLVYRCGPSLFLFPYTTLFRSCLLKSSPAIQPRLPPDLPRSRAGRYPHTARVRLPPRRSLPLPYTDLRVTLARSEEHTSELQSRENIVCRLLLEKKNKKKVYST